MRRHLLILALLLPALPAVSQRAPEGTGALVSPSRPPAAEAVPPAAPRRARPPGPNGRAAEATEPEGGLIGMVDDPETLLRLAERMTVAGRTDPEVNEILERAATRLLTRSELASRIEEPVREGAVADLTEARAALLRRDAADATRFIRNALERLHEAQIPLEERAIR